MSIRKLGPYLRSSDVPTWKKGLGLLGVLYIVWPIDAIPDTIPVLGWLDDVGVLALLVAWVRRELSRFSETR
ncbi:YkvA family protein [Nocardioides bruguierae]|uniref:DUF1232 domain-containing protein n=1 Tax=Nocardioides bruguierae TaxID=2945102 RepID=A0A9X2IDY9_9ACTN|nr:DUF1232 domain-containing protein [Nocardioides bruguierae]MCM0619523.1 DUF1232 domain-containing protein [Nocardioides bruguierae]